MLKKIVVTLAALLALGVGSAMACPALPSITVIDLSAASSVLAGGSTSNKTGYVTAGAYDASFATASQGRNSVSTFTTTAGAAYTNSPKNAGGMFLGSATAVINSTTFSIHPF